MNPSLSFAKYYTFGTLKKMSRLLKQEGTSAKITNKYCTSKCHFPKVSFSPIQTRIPAWDIPQNDLLSNIDQRIGPLGSNMVKLDQATILCSLQHTCIIHDIFI